MDNVWKAFEANEVTHSTAHHLMIIAQLIDELGYARVTDVANRLDITRGSASITLKALEKNALVERDVNGFLRLPPRAKFIARLTSAKKSLVRQFLHDVLEVSEGNSDVDSCKIEHLLSTESGHKLCALVHFLTSENPAAKEFLAAFRTFCRRKCKMEDCELCEGEARCLFAT